MVPPKSLRQDLNSGAASQKVAQRVAQGGASSVWHRTADDAHRRRSDAFTRIKILTDAGFEEQASVFFDRESVSTGSGTTSKPNLCVAQAVHKIVPW